jgi:M6 family metalloprotease-like protein
MTENNEDIKILDANGKPISSIATTKKKKTHSITIQIIVSLSTILAAIVTIFNSDAIIQLIMGNESPRFSTETPVVKPLDPIIFMALNKAADIDEDLSVKFDGLDFHKKAKLITKEDFNRWEFHIKEQIHTKDMLKLVKHKIKLASSSHDWSDEITVEFTDKDVRYDSRNKRKITNKINNASPSAKSNTAGKPFLPGRRLTKGNIKGLTILVEFEDISFRIPKKEIDDIFNGEKYKKYDNYCSVREYFKIMSNGKLNYTSDVVGPIKLKRPRQYYTNKPFFAEVLGLAVNELGINLKDYDSRNENVVDLVHFIYAGNTLYQGWLWPHSHVLDYSHKELKTRYYVVSPSGLKSNDLAIGIFCHEIAQALCRFPNLYDFGKRDGDFEISAGLGRYCLMAAGNHLNKGRTPSPICAYLRELAGWPDHEVLLNIPGKYTIKQGDYSTIYKYKTGNANEYFLVENRVKFGLDAFLPSSGLAVYHCDIFGSNEWQDGTQDKHYQCALLQADGNRDLEKNENTGDLKDLWGNHEGVVIDYNTSPSSRMWNGASSGFILKNISIRGKEIQFETE